MKEDEATARRRSGIVRRAQCGYCGATKSGRVSHTGFRATTIGPDGCCDAAARLPADGRFESRSKGRLPGWTPLRAVPTGAAPAADPPPPPAADPVPPKRRARRTAPAGGDVDAKWQKVLDAFASGNPNKVAGTLYRYNVARVAAGSPKMTIQEAREAAA